MPQPRIVSAEPIFLFGRPIQLSAKGLCGDFSLSLNGCTTFWSRSLFPLDSDLNRVEITVSLSRSAQVSLTLQPLSTESQSANTFVRLVPDEPRFNKVGTLLVAAACLLLLEAPECRGA